MSMGELKGWFTVADHEVQFTPGPWKGCKADQCPCGLIWSIPADIVVAKAATAADKSITGGDGIVERSPEFFANARLIAAAPEMYQALKAFVNEADSYHLLSHGVDDTYSASKCDGICACLPAAKKALAKAEGL